MFYDDSPWDFLLNPFLWAFLVLLVMLGGIVSSLFNSVLHPSCSQVTYQDSSTVILYGIYTSEGQYIGSDNHKAKLRIPMANVKFVEDCAN